MSEDKENGKEPMGFWVSHDNAEHFRAMAAEARQKLSALLEILIEQEWERRQALKAPTTPNKRRFTQEA